MLDLDQLLAAVAAAKRQFGLLREKYPKLKGYLVMSMPGGQAGIDSSPLQILNEFPAMVVDDSIKTSALNLLSGHPEVTIGAETERRKQQLNQLACRLNYDGKCQIEIRFHHLNYDLIGQLQMDDLIGRNLTPQTKASIRIVLGTLAQFERNTP